MMLDLIRQWLNSKKDYDTGVAIYSQNNPDGKLLAVLRNGENDFRRKRLLDEILVIYKNLSAFPAEAIAPGAKKIASNANKVASAANKIQETEIKYSQKEAKNIPAVAEQEQTPANKELYDACKLAADTEYKKVMNARAVLFKKASPDSFIDVNKPDLIFDRGELAIEILQGWKKVSELYDRAEFVKESGRLPSTPESERPENEYEHIPDSLVKQQLDNARKAYNKLKKKTSTPERVALLQKHEANIKKLKEKWDSLQPKQ